MVINDATGATIRKAQGMNCVKFEAQARSDNIETAFLVISES